MKMICPRCGVKGSAHESLLGKMVKCPKCLGMFEITSEMLQPLDVDVVELEQIYDSPNNEPVMSDEEEVDDVLNRLLADDADTAAPAADDHIEEVEALHDEMLDDEVIDDELTAALAGLDDSPDANFPGDDGEETGFDEEEEEDDTLTIIEDFPDEVEGDDLAEELQDEEEGDILTFDDSVTMDQPPADEEEELDFEFDDEMELEEAAAEEEFEGNDEVEIDDAFLDEFEKDADEEELQQPETDDLSDEDGAETDEIADVEYEDDEQNEDAVESDEEELQEEQENAIQKCSACDEYVNPQDKHEYEGYVYCSKCVPTELKNKISQEKVKADMEVESAPGRFTITTLLKDAWHYAKGVKGAIWGGIFIMYLVLIGIGVVAALGLPYLVGQVDPLQIIFIESGLEMLFSFLSFVFSAGIILIAIHKIGQKPFSWRMVFAGFRKLGSLLLLFILQAIMLVIGFILFILPGIYLSVGYILAIPLLFMKGLSPWQALEVSRKAVHKRWWTVFCSFIAMGMLVTLSMIPLGIGLIWTVPMFTVLIGVLYYHFFGADED